jgi:hypothetical protein
VPSSPQAVATEKIPKTARTKVRLSLLRIFRQDA